MSGDDKAATGGDVESGAAAPSTDVARECIINPCNENFTCGCLFNWFWFWENIILNFFEQTLGRLLCQLCQGDGKLNQFLYLIPLDLRTTVRFFSLLGAVQFAVCIKWGVDYLETWWFWGIAYIAVGGFGFWMCWMWWRGASHCMYPTLVFSLNIMAWLLISMIGMAVYQTAFLGTTSVTVTYGGQTRTYDCGSACDPFTFGDFLIKLIVVFCIGFLFGTAHVVKLAVLIRGKLDDGYSPFAEGEGNGSEAQVKAWEENAKTLAFHGCPFIGQGEGASSGGDASAAD